MIYIAISATFSALVCAIIILLVINRRQAIALSLNMNSDIDDNLLFVAGEVNEKFQQFTKLSDQQFELMSQLEQPSASAAHGRNKQQIVKEAEDLEDKKLAILKEILDKGVDFEVTVVSHNGNEEEMKISKLLAQQEQHVESLKNLSNSVGKTDSKNNSNRKTHLQLVKEESNDNTNDPEIH